jgi:hypothetical protein
MNIARTNFPKPHPKVWENRQKAKEKQRYDYPDGAP